MTYIQTNKDKRKIVRVVIQILILAIVLVCILRAMFVFTTYQPFDTKTTHTSRETGFIALSYIGVARESTETLIASNQLKQHLQALYDQGYVTITPQDIINYYQEKKPLPAKSLFLMFEDGRRDTAIFAQKILEQFNYCATILSYGKTITNDDSKFLNAKQLQELEDTSYFQLGSNGYQLSYINVFDRYQNYIGELNSNQFSHMTKYLQRDYNHYLMDYLRDENRISKESYQEMEQRITNDYQQLKNIYQEMNQTIPLVHVLQHSNTGQFGSNEEVSSINEKKIKEMFKINFNREGSCFNQETTSIYNLTRMQPQSYWTTNHLLMKIQTDTNVPIAFIMKNRQEDILSLVEGALYYHQETIFLTTPHTKQATLKIANKSLVNTVLDVTLQGNKAGIQGIYFRSDQEYKNAIYVELVNDTLEVKEIKDGISKTLQTVFLPKEVDDISYQTKIENNIEGQIALLETDIAASKRQEYVNRIEELSSKKNQQREEYIPEIDIKQAQDRKLEIVIKDNKISIKVDSKEIIKEMEITKTTSGDVFLVAKPIEEGYSQRNISDQVYDGIFNQLTVTSNDQTIVTSTLSGVDKIRYYAGTYFEKIINWFIETL